MEATKIDAYLIHDGIVVTLDGTDLPFSGEVAKERATQVESDGLGWRVTAAPHELNGQFARKLIGAGFKTRQEALEFERLWIMTNVFGAQQ